MKFIINRDFREYVQQPEWLSLDSEDLTKKTWKRFGSKSNYLNYKYSNDWRIIYTSNNQILLEREIVDLIKNSLEDYFSNKTKLIEFIDSITVPQNINYKKKNEEDSVSLFSAKIVSNAIKEFILAHDTDINLGIISDWIRFNNEYFYSIPFIHPELILHVNSRKNPWSDESIEAFLRNNQIIQIKRKTLEQEGIGIAIFLRKDLKLGKGKSGAQLSHGAISLLHQPIFRTEYHDKFIKSEYKNVLIFTVSDLKDIKELEHLCLTQKVNHFLISDAGHTQIAPGTITTIAVGPLPIIWLQILAYNIEGFDLNS